MPSPLRPRSNSDGVEGPETPEALMISALLHDGLFEPEKFGLHERHLSCWNKLWRFGVEYQQKEGKAPPLNLVTAKFPDFEFTPEVGPRYAADQLHQAAASRDMRTRARTMLKALEDEDLSEAYEAMRGLTPPRSIAKPAVSIWDQSENDQFEVSKIPLAYQTLGRASGGIGPGEVWYIGGRPGVGKTWTVCAYVAAAVKQAYNVRYLSLEMPSKAIIKRVRRILAAPDSKLLAQLDSPDWTEHKKAVDALKERIEGTFAAIDPSHGRGTNAAVREQMNEGDLVVVDHVGLMYTPEGQRAIHDWRAQAWISNQLKEDTLSSGIPILGAVQLNRAAESSSEKAPGADKVGGSDALVQDADVVVTMKRLSKSVMVHSAEKVREGAGVGWFSRFDPEKARFEEITRDQGIELQAMDDDRDAAS